MVKVAVAFFIIQKEKKNIVKGKVKKKCLSSTLNLKKERMRSMQQHPVEMLVTSHLAEVGLLIDTEPGGQTLSSAVDTNITNDLIRGSVDRLTGRITNCVVQSSNIITSSRKSPVDAIRVL